MNFDLQYEDNVRKAKQKFKCEHFSRYCDFIYYTSSLDNSLRLAARILKPEKPSYILATTHGWHMSIPEFREYNSAQSDYLRVEVDMRGRAFSDGQPDCNGYELFDIIDAIEYVKKNYAEFIIDPETVFFEAGSGGGGNALAIACKFPDYFSHITALCGISDYEKWYIDDEVGEFRDELCVWVGDISNKEAYATRSGAKLTKNLTAPLAIVHGGKDIRVPISHAKEFISEARKNGKGKLINFLELSTVGGWSHWENITEAEINKRDTFIIKDRNTRKTLPKILQKGELTVGGYLVTRHFSVFLKDINRIATLRYDLTEKTATLEGFDRNEYEIYWR